MSIGVVFVVFVLFLVLGVPIGVAVGAAALSASIFNPGLPAHAGFVFRNMITALDVYSLLAVPMFILSGCIMAQGGISKKIFDFFAFFIGGKTAGMPIAVIVTCLFYGAISGSGPATVAAIGSMSIPLLAKLGYDRRFATAMVAVAGGLGVIIPPSIPFIMYGLSANESVGALFLAGVVPGVLIGCCLMLYAYYYCRTRGEDKSLLLENTRRLRERGFAGIFLNSFFALLTPVIILGGIYGGVVTPTEAAAVSVVYALAISMVWYRSFGPADLWSALRDTARTAAPVMLVVSTATVFGRVLTMMQAPQTIAAIITASIASKVVLLVVINLFLLFVGMIMDTTPAILILVPIFLPIATGFGIDPIHFGVIMVVNLAIGFVTPPIRVTRFVASYLPGRTVLTLARREQQ
ncbi:MAG: TRAP transporter large permease, partial [Planctomycetes bacterium]|nr:TRAP transporter large permease [Planctomycetota bacterium]